MSGMSEFNLDSAAEIDHEHEVQLNLLHELCNAVREQRDDTLVDGILDQLVAYSEVHFASEELLMRLKSYDDYEDHVDDHSHMLDVLKAIVANHAAGNSALLSGQAEELLGFIGHHIETRDKRFADFVRKAH